MTDRPAAAPSPAGHRTADRLHLSPRHRAQLEALLREHLPGVEVWAYGSRITGESHDGSDLDLVLRAPDLQKIPIGRLSDLWEALRESTIPFLVEARDWAWLPEGFHEEIERDYVVLVEGHRNAEHVEKANRQDPTERHPRRGWRRANIEEIAEKVAMGPFGSSIKVETFTPTGVPIISGQHLHGSRVDDEPRFNFISDEHAERLRGANVRKGDVIFTHRGNIGQVAYVPKNAKYDRYVISQSQFYMRPDPSQAIPEFLTAYFKTAEGQHDLLANTSQVGVPSIAQPVTYLRTLDVPLPSVEEQRAIAHVLGTLDDKIELNRRMNETLAAMARALFQSWFVDFDPVRAKIDGRDTGLPTEIAGLFPDRLVDSELGQIPDSWSTGYLSELATVAPKQINPSNVAGDTPYIGLEHMPRRSVALSDWGTATKITSSKSVFKKGDFLFGKLRPYFHKVGIAPVDGICSTDIVVVTPRIAKLDSFVLAVISSESFVAYTDRSSTGTKMPRTTWKQMAGFRLPLPPSELMERYSDIARLWFNRIVNNIQESKGLASVHDALLPKLVSGDTYLYNNHNTLPLP